MIKLEIHYEARCKHCSMHKVLKRKTYCTKDIQKPKTFAKIINEGRPIRLKDRACKDFKL